MLITITICNWEKFNPRSDRSNYSWFRLQNSFFHDQQIFSLNDSSRLLFLFLCCEASKNNKAEFEIHLDYVSMILRRKQSEISNSIKSLQNSRLLAVKEPSSSRLNDGQEPANGRPTDVRTDETDVRRVSTKVDSLAQVWNEECGTLPKTQGTSDKRLKQSSVRLKENPDLEYWRVVVRRMAKSDFCRGLTDRGTWRATYDFLLKPDTHIKVMEGKYDGPKTQPSNRPEYQKFKPPEIVDELSTAEAKKRIQETLRSMARSGDEK